MNIPLKYCDCPEPVVTEEQFCDTCGTEYQVSRNVFRDRLSPGEPIGPYRVVDRQRMWAILEDTSGQRFRFWPTGDTGARNDLHVPVDAELNSAVPAMPSEVALDAQSGLLHGAHSESLLFTPTPEPSTEPTPSSATSSTLASEYDVGEMQSVPEALSTSAVTLTNFTGAPESQPFTLETPGEALSSAVTEADPHQRPAESAPEVQEELHVEPIAVGELPVQTDCAAPLSDPSSSPEVHPGPDVASPATPSEVASSTPELAPPIHLRHFTFLPAQVTVLDSIPGYLEPERPEKFTGTEILSLRTLLDTDPRGDDRQPARLLSWLVQCAQAMKSAHEQGMLVNSFTPDTVFIDYDPAATRAERIAISTALYAAPFGQGSRVAGYAPQGDEPLTPRTDVYQIGALLRDLIGWQPDQVWTDEPDAVFGQPMHLVRLLMHLMHTDPARRPSGEQLKKLLIETQQAFTSQHVLDVAGVTDTGLNREHNEDAFGYLQFEEHAGRGHLSTTILVVCDGVGGANAGEEASRLAVREVLASLVRSADTERPVPRRLEEAILQANTRLMGLSADHKGAGCTIVTVYIRGQEYWVAHAGDSRAYVCVNGLLRGLTADHSWTAQQVRKGLLTAEEAAKHENAHVIYRSLGERERLEVEVQPAEGPGFPLEAGTVFLLCTDGVTDVLSDDRLRDLLSSNRRSPRDKARLCVQAANAAGGPDNITALVAIQEIHS